MTQPHTPRKPGKSLLPAIAGLAIVAGLIAGVYVLSSATSKPKAEASASLASGTAAAAAQSGYGRFATGALSRLQIIASPPAQPDLPLYGSDGAPTQLAAFRGKATLVNVWATWCAPCISEMPTLAALATEYRDRGLLVVPVSIDEANKASQARDVLKGLSGGALDFYIEPSKQLPVALLPKGGALGVPVTILYDSQGREIARLTGGADWASPQAHALIDAALAAS